MTTPANAALVETTTADSFDSDVLKAAGPIAVEFMSYGCTHCRTIEPKIRR
jgi:thiol-disulfide isomerase/thioredoxin